MKDQKRKLSLGGFLLVMLFVILGMGVTILIEQGGTQWLWLGAALGGGTGVAVAQGMGLWPKKKK